MSIPHPFSRLSPGARRRLFRYAVVLTFVLMAAIHILDRPLKTAPAPSGIVSFELAGNLSRAREILDSWGEPGKLYAALSLGVDYLFLFAYAAAISLGCVLLGRRLGAVAPGFARLGFCLGWAQWGAASLDAVENFALIRVLLGSGNGLWPGLSWACALVKFLIVGAGIFYLILGGLALVGNRRRRPAPEITEPSRRK